MNLWDTHYFDKYDRNHLLRRGSLAKSEWAKIDNENGFVKYCENQYLTFSANCLKNIATYEYWFGEKARTTLIDSYFNTKNNEEFLFRYSNILALLFSCIFFGEKTQSVRWNIINDFYHEFLVSFSNGIEGRISFVYLDMRKKVRLLQSGKKFVELETAMTRTDVSGLNEVLDIFGMSCIDLELDRIVESINMSTHLQVAQKKDFNAIVFYHSADSDDNYSINSLPKILYSEKSGLLENKILQTEYGIEETAREEISDIMVYKKNAQFLLLGNFLEIVRKDYYRKFHIDEFKSSISFKIWSQLNECDFISKVGFYNVADSELLNMVNATVTRWSEKYKGICNSEFKDLFIESFIKAQLIQNERLVTAFSNNYDEFINGMIGQYNYLFGVISKKYPINHPFRQPEFMFDGIAFSLAYCLYIVPKYLHNTEMMIDMVEKKLISQVNNSFSLKLFNEGFSELEIFLYIIFGLFCYSNEYTNFDNLEYEPNGSNNKRFEYAFLMKDGKKINIEVKALECEPEYADKINLFKMKDGQLFYKNYFPACDESEIVPEDIRKKSIALKSNYRQVSKNIKKIYEKCDDKDDDVNIGFIMINYGTSREEYISYMVNKHHGYLYKNPMENHNVDAFVIFSMCMDTDLLMDKILEKEHILVFVNNQRAEKELLGKMRLSNIVDETKQDYLWVAEECYGEFEGVNSDGVLTIQRKITAEGRRELEKTINEINENAEMKNVGAMLVNRK